MNKKLDGTESVYKRALKLAVSTLFFAGDWLWRRTQRLFAMHRPGTCVVLYYHAVRPEQRLNFARQMDLVSRLSKPVKSDGTAALGSGHHVAVVFHDAFVSVFENALPELASRGIPSTIFVPSGFMGKRQGWIKDPDHVDYQEYVIDAARLRSMDPMMVSIGSHTVTHADLCAASEAEAKFQLGSSKSDLEAILGYPVDVFAFPFGRSTESLTRLAQEMGYKRVFTINPKLALSDPYEFITGSCPALTTDWPLEFRLKMLGAYRWLPTVYSLRQTLAGWITGKPSVDEAPPLGSGDIKVPNIIGEQVSHKVEYARPPRPVKR